MNPAEPRFEWLGESEMSALIRATDWAATPLGPIDGWPASLRTTVSLCLASNFPINIVWGEDAVQLYNAGYRVLCGAAHPRAIGESYRVTWASAWPVIGEPFERARRGETSYLENQRMFLERNGYLEETFFTFSLSPIRDEAGGIAGIFHPVTETTSVMLSERRTRALRDVANKAGSAESIFEASRLVTEILSEYRLDVPWLTLLRYDAANDRLRLLASLGLDDDSPARCDRVTPSAAPWPFREVLDSAHAAQLTLVSDVEAKVGRIPCGEYPEATSNAFVVPIKSSAAGPPFGVAVVGLSTRLPVDDAYRSFVEMLGAILGTVLGAALGYEEDQRKADELAALDEAKTAFFSNVSHEFRTPLTLMLGPLEEALADLEEPLPPRQRARHELISRNALRLLKLVNTLLDFSRIQADRVEGVFRPTDLARLTADLASVFRAAIEKAGLTFRVELEDLGEPVFVDHEMWEKIVLNLLSNAFKFTFEGEIEVRLSRRVTPEGERACLSVRDTGGGIAERELPRLFQRFHRTESARGRTYEGSGIGLALIQELVKLHGGTIHATSKEGVGSTFEVYVPLGSAHLSLERVSLHPDSFGISSVRSAFVAEASRWAPDRPAVSDAETSVLGDRAPSAAPRARAHAHRILIADDNADMRAYVKGLLQPLGDVEAVEDGQAALEAIHRRVPDLIISDVMMPRLDGTALLAKLRADPLLAATPFVLLSAKAGEESRMEGLRLGADDFLVKPFSAKELVARATTQLKLGDARRMAATERNRLHEFFMQAPIPMAILLGPEHRFTLANAPYERLVGQPVVGATVREVFEPHEAEVVVPLLDDVYATGRSFLGKERPFRFRDPAGVPQERFLDVNYQPFRDAAGGTIGILAVVVDVTEQVHARKRVEESVVEMMQERGLRERFVMTLTHDLLTPLTSARLNAELLGRSTDEFQRKQAASRILKNVDRAQVMIRDLLDANRLKAGERMPLVRREGRLDAILGNIARALTELHGDRFRVRNAAGAVPGRWDENAIRRVIENLASNAVKYGRADAPVILSLHRQDDWVELAVHNEGSHLSPEEQAAIFTPFHRTQSASTGTQSGWGVGLTLVKAIAEAHGGSARVESDADSGTTFFVRLPLESHRGG